MATSLPSLPCILLSLLLWAGTCEAQGPDKISAEQLRNVHKASRLDKQSVSFLVHIVAITSQSVPLQNFSSLLSRKSFRCGLFFPDPKTEGARPVAPLFIFNNSWAAEECPAGNTARYGRFCDSIVSLRKGPLTSLMALNGLCSL